MGKEEMEVLRIMEFGSELVGGNELAAHAVAKRQRNVDANTGTRSSHSRSIDFIHPMNASHG
jgi:hypothetical protein